MKIQLVQGQLVNLLTYNDAIHICVSEEAPNQDVLPNLDAHQVEVNNDCIVYVNNNSVDEREDKQYFQVVSDFIIYTSNVNFFGRRIPS